MSSVEAGLRETKKVSERYAGTARRYDSRTGYEETHHRHAIDLAKIRDGDKVLEVASGTGRALIEIARRVGRSGRVSAIDLTQEMLNVAREKLIRNGLLERVELRQGDARSLPFGSNEFDLLYNGYMFDLLGAADMPLVLSEFKRVLKPEGRLVLVNMSKNTKRKTAYEILYERGLGPMVACRPVMLEPLVREAGFVDVERVYRKNDLSPRAAIRSYMLSVLTGAEIILARKPSYGPGESEPLIPRV